MMYDVYHAIFIISENAVGIVVFFAMMTAMPTATAKKKISGATRR